MEPFIGQIVMFGGNFAPRGWALCNGQLLAISQNSALFSILGTTYGGDGRTTFGLPDLRGRAPVSPGQGPGLSNYRWGEKEGNEVTTLTVANLPSHTHAARAQSSDGDSATPVGNVWADDLGVSSATYSTAGANSNMNAQAIANTGGNRGFSNIAPRLAVYFIIALLGTYPSRN